VLDLRPRLNALIFFAFSFKFDDLADLADASLLGAWVESSGATVAGGVFDCLGLFGILRVLIKFARELSDFEPARPCSD